MRTTVTIEADVAALLKSAMKRTGASFKEALNDALRRGLSSNSGVGRKQVLLPGIPMKMRPGINLDKALRLASELEDEELERRLEVGK
ncbi:MAG: hypothetical protein ACLPJH_09855 [Myxococcaceae bacterium]